MSTSIDALYDFVQYLVSKLLVVEGKIFRLNFALLIEENVGLPNL